MRLSNVRATAASCLDSAGAEQTELMALPRESKSRAKAGRQMAIHPSPEQLHSQWALENEKGDRPGRCVRYANRRAAIWLLNGKSRQPFILHLSSYKGLRLYLILCGRTSLLYSWLRAPIIYTQSSVMIFVLISLGEIFQYFCIILLNSFFFAIVYLVKALEGFCVIIVRLECVQNKGQNVITHFFCPAIKKKTREQKLLSKICNARSAIFPLGKQRASFQNCWAQFCWSKQL